MDASNGQKVVQLPTEEIATNATSDDVKDIEDEEEVFETPEQQSSEVAAELKEMVQTQEKNSHSVRTQAVPSQGERPVSKLNPIPVTNVKH